MRSVRRSRPSKRIFTAFIVLVVVSALVVIVIIIVIVVFFFCRIAVYLWNGSIGFSSAFSTDYYC